MAHQIDINGVKLNAIAFDGEDWVMAANIAPYIKESQNIYAAAISAAMDFASDSNKDMLLCHFIEFCQDRLNAAKQNKTLLKM